MLLASMRSEFHSRPRRVIGSSLLSIDRPGAFSIGPIHVDLGLDAGTRFGVHENPDFHPSKSKNADRAGGLWTT